MNLLFIDGNLQDIQKKQYYYDVKKKAYIGAMMPKDSDDMFKCWLKANRNEAIPSGDIIIPLEDKCLCFTKGQMPRLLQKGTEMRLFDAENGNLASYGKSITLMSMFDSEDMETFGLEGYSFTINNVNYCVIYSEYVNTGSKLEKMLKKVIKLDAEAGYYLDTPCRQDLYIDHYIRKDARKTAFKNLITVFKENRQDSEKIKEAFYTWKSLF